VPSGLPGLKRGLIIIRKARERGREGELSGLEENERR